ncbi:MAG: orotidine-5'-phosphate decarboxylase [Gemmatimonadaceae bacterium]|nr:orotidine-5'-phosphate decarboxylase [Gemmatimonadaceae bacterium]
MGPEPIVALDVGGADEALALARRVGAACRFYKVGSELFTAAGPAVIRRLRDEVDADVFLDLKFHDIPTTVAGAVRSAAALGVRLLTVHASGGAEMVTAAQEAAGERCGVLGVTVLTSHDAVTQGAAWGRKPVEVIAEVVRLAGVMAAAGGHGVVCSGLEAAAVRERHPRLAVLVPGIRFAGGAGHDQRRTVTPADARGLGARYVVLGRAVTRAADPAAAMAQAAAALRGERTGP